MARLLGAPPLLYFYSQVPSQVANKNNKGTSEVSEKNKEKPVGRTIYFVSININQQRTNNFFCH